MIITRFNGLDIHHNYVKISNKTYIHKILLKNPLMFEDYKPNNIPVPSSDDKTYAKYLESAIPPTTVLEKLEL